MSLTRSVVIAAVAVALLPVDKDTQTEFRDHAASATTWALTFCERNSETCTTASEHWAVFKEKVSFAVELAGDGIATYLYTQGGAPTSIEHAGNPSPGSVGLDTLANDTTDPEGSGPESANKDTLYPWDRTPRWGGPRQATGSF